MFQVSVLSLVLVITLIVLWFVLHYKKVLYKIYLIIGFNSGLNCQIKSIMLIVDNQVNVFSHISSKGSNICCY